jgi:hypothetical protein
MSNLLKRYIRLAVKEAHLARVPDQLVSTGEHEEEGDEGEEGVNEFAAAGGGGNALAAGGIQGFTAPLGGDVNRKKRPKS